MARRRAFVKVSGDLCTSPEFLGFVWRLSREYFVVICVGGGTQINQAFTEAGLPVGTHGPMGRETRSPEEHRLAQNVLEKNRTLLLDKLESLGICARVIIPVLEIGSVACHVNGDQMVRTAYIGFDKLYVITTNDRKDKKIEEFVDLPKIEIVSFSPS